MPVTFVWLDNATGAMVGNSMLYTLVTLAVVSVVGAVMKVADIESAAMTTLTGFTLPGKVMTDAGVSRSVGGMVMVTTAPGAGLAGEKVAYSVPGTTLTGITRDFPPAEAVKLEMPSAVPVMVARTWVCESGSVSVPSEL